MNEGIAERDSLIKAGFNDEEIGAWETETREKLTAAGFNPKETDEYFGVHNDPDMSATKAVIEQNVAIAKTLQANPKKGDTRPADSFVDALEAGYQMSVTGLIQRQKLPDIVLPEDAGMMARIGSQVGQIAGDVPAMIAGSFAAAPAGSSVGAAAGGVIGSVVPGPGTLIGGAIGATAGGVVAGFAGANALPEAMRTAMMDHYQKGDIQNAADFWERSSSVFLSAFKAGTAGAAGSVAGGVVGQKLIQAGSGAVMKAALPAMTELATMVTVGKGMEGELPNARDFLDGAVLIAGLHGATSVAGKMRNVYSKTGLKPINVGELANEHPTIQQELVADNIDMPKALENYVEKPKALKGRNDLPPYDPEVAVKARTESMISELKTATRESGVARDAEGNVVARTDNNSFPEWFQRVKSGNHEKTMADLSNPESAAYKRLKAEAESQLTEGYKLSREGGYEAPDAQFRANKGLNPHEATPVLSGEVVHFDGSDGVVKTADGQMIHFDQSVVKENFNVGDVVNLLQDPKSPDFPTAETVFGTRTKQALAEANIEKIIVDEDGSVKVKTPGGGERPPTDVESILSRIGERGERPKTPFSIDKFYTDYVDKYNPIKLAQEKLGVTKDTPTDMKPYELTRMANDYKAKVKHFYERGTVDFKTLETNGKSFKEIIEPFSKVPEKIDGLKAFMISKRVLEVEGRGITSGFDVETAKRVVKEGQKEFGNAATEIVEFQNRALKYALDAGVINSKSYKAMLEAGKSYVSLSRVLDPETTGKAAGKSKPLKNLKGSDKMIQDPFVSMIENTEALVKASEKNRALMSMVDLAKSVDGQLEIEKVKTNQRPIRVTEGELVNAIKDTELGRILQEEGIDIEGEDFNIFRPVEKNNLAPNEFEVMNQGKREVYKTATPELAEAFKRLDGDKTAMNLAFKLANAVTTVKKVGITFTPDFILKNVFRDQLTAGVFTEGGALPFKDIFHAMGDILNKNDHYYNWMKSGGAGGAFLELDTSYLSNDLLQLNKDTNMGQKVFNLVQKPVEMIALLGKITEEGTRLAEFKRVTKGESAGAPMFKGGMASREVTVDFQRVGAKMSAMNAITAFMNVGVQGLDRTARAVKKDPAGVTSKGLMYLTAPSMLLWYANKDDERVKEIPRWQKDLFWIIPTDDWQPAKDASEVTGLPKHLVKQNEDGTYSVNKGHIYRLPKPQELGMIFSTIPERMMEKLFTDNPRALDDLTESMASLVTPNFIPDAALPLIEQGVNKNLFTSAPLVSPQMEGRLSELQYTEYTSETAKTLGKLIGMMPIARDIGADNTKLSSPAVVDNYIRSWTGALGSYVVEVADKALMKTGVVDEYQKPTATLAEIPFIKAFVIRHPSASVQSIQDFYKRNTEAEKVFKSIDFLTKSGDLEGVRKITDNEDYEEIMVKTDGIKKALGQMSSAVKSIYANKQMNKDEKRQQIDTIYYQMTEVAREGNKYMDLWADSVKKKNNK